MLRLRFFRVLLPAALVLFLVMIVYALRPRVQPHRQPGEMMSVSDEARGLEVTHYVDGQADLEISAEQLTDDGENRYHLEGIDRISIVREGKPPLLVQAALGDISGDTGARTMRFDTGVVIVDPDADLTLTLPVLDVDEAAGEARCDGEVQLEGSSLNGRAAGLVYSLEGKPTELSGVELWDTLEGRLSADTALLHDGVDDIELRGAVRVRRVDEWMNADNLRLVRGSDDVLRTANAAGAVSGQVISASGSRLGLQCENVDVDWDDTGEIEGLRLTGAAEVHQGSESLAADTIDAVRRAGKLEGWDVVANGTVYAQGRPNGQPAWLRAASIEGHLGPTFELRSAQATGGVTFDGPQTHVEGERGSYTLDLSGGEIRLFGDGRDKARLGREKTRVAADSIVTDARGQRLVAEGRVEASLLPSGASEAPRAPGMFRVEDAVHFVSARLESTGGGRRLEFSGGVRGWQAERNLSAKTLVMDQDQQRMTAREEVSTRIPRIATRTATEADYVLVSADHLQYDESGRLAVYDGAVRVRVVEGWMEAERMEVELESAGEGIREIRAEGAVRIEFREPGNDSAPMVLTGKSDRMVYTPAVATVTLHGVDSPASVRRVGEGGGTTTGRGLVYHLDTGTLEVDAGEGGEARIHTKGGS